MTNAAKQLLKLADLPSSEEIAKPDWGGRSPDAWVNYLPEGIAAVWPELAEESRLACYVCAKESARYDISLDE